MSETKSYGADIIPFTAGRYAKLPRNGLLTKPDVELEGQNKFLGKRQYNHRSPRLGNGTIIVMFLFFCGRPNLPF